jgi:hypothetical protein
MPKETIWLNSEKTESVNMEWGFNWRNLTIRHQGNILGIISDRKTLRNGTDFALDRERTLSVKLSGRLFPDLLILLNGSYIPGSSIDPREKLKQIHTLTFIFGLFNLSAGIVLSLYYWKDLEKLEEGLGAGVTGLIIIILGYQIRKSSYLALFALISILLIEIILTGYFESIEKTKPDRGICLKLFILLFAFKGIKAIRTIKAERLKVNILN